MGFVVLKTGCWQWTGKKLKSGYGYFFENGKTVLAHRWIHVSIPGNKEIHHTCKNRACVNPSHLIAMTRKEHRRLEPTALGRRKTHCVRGHEFTGENTYWCGGFRNCKKCHLEVYNGSAF